MKRVNVVVEGQTEETFVRDVLYHDLWPRQVFLTPLLVTHGVKGAKGKGGLNKYNDLRSHVTRLLKDQTSPDVRVTTMVDLYALPSDFPGREHARQTADPQEAVRRLEAAFESDIGDPRFVPYVQLHEFESLLFADIRRLRDYFPDGDERIDGGLERLADVLRTFDDDPERVDEGHETAPSKRIIQAVPPYAGAKPVAGPLVAAWIGVDAIRQRCRHFDEWVRVLEGLGEPPS